MSLSSFLANLGIEPKDFNIFLEAFTHSSYTNEKKDKNIKHYERLEFLGDAVLQYYVSDYLFKLYPDQPEGNLTKLRSKLVREESLALFSRELGIPEHIRLGTGEERNGGRDRNSVLADIFESFIGAVSLECGSSKIIEILSRTVFEHVEDIDSEDIQDYKTMLQEMIQADQRKTVTYELISSQGPSNAPIFDIAVVLDGMVLGEGTGTSKKRAAQNAAKDALAKLATNK